MGVAGVSGTLCLSVVAAPLVSRTAALDVARHVVEPAPPGRAPPRPWPSTAQGGQRGMSLRALLRYLFYAAAPSALTGAWMRNRLIRRFRIHAPGSAEGAAAENREGSSALKLTPRWPPRAVLGHARETPLPGGAR